MRVRFGILASMAMIAAWSPLSAADKLIMKSGRVYEGRIVGESAEEIKILTNGMTIGFAPKLIERIDREPVEAAPNSLPDADKMLVAAQSIAPEEWVQIPATVIEEGVLRNVPYRSYRAGKLELNIYGDPSSPAGVEVGIYGASPSVPFKRRLISFISEVTGAEFPDSFNIDEDKKRLGVIDYEVTPPTSPDAYGAWWISAYDMTRLETARVADNEMNEIAVRRAEIAGKAKESDNQRESSDWTAHDLARAIRPTQTQLSMDYASYSTGRVWVRGYTRKDGTYVRPHSRSR